MCVPRPAKELHLATCQVVDPTMNLHLTQLYFGTEESAVLEEFVHGVEDVHLHGVSRHGVLLRLCPELRSRLQRHRREALEHGVQERSPLARGGLPALAREHGLRGARDGAAPGVPKHEDKLGAEVADGILHAADHAALCVRAGVPGVAQHEEVTGLGVEEELHGAARVRAADDGGRGPLAVLGQGVAPLVRGMVAMASLVHIALVALSEHLQGQGWLQGAMEGCAGPAPRGNHDLAPGARGQSGP
mmetsp:Transcript_10222/g.21122  ORF Transcript_10222/g.21122 Transcript_10222/m.21122 type:complete len:246 (-) Transcript_10222:13-750(-)